MKSLRVSVVILIIYLSIISSKETEPTLKFKVTKIGPIYNITNIGENILIENQPFTIKITSEYGLSYLNCTSPSRKIHDGFIYEDRMSNEKYFYVNKEESFVPEMGGTWRCAVTILSVTTVEWTFPVHVRRKGVGAIYINNKRRDTQLTDYYVINYDENDLYTFTEGELSELTCEATEPGDTVSMTLNDNKGIKIVIPGYNGKSSILMRLTMRYHEGYLDCKVNAHTNNELSIIRVNLSGQTLPDGYCTFKINGQLVLPEATRNKWADEIYNYEYFDGETVDITTMVDRKAYKEDMDCVTNASSVPQKLEYLKQKVKDIHTSVVLKKEHNNLRIKCVLEKKKSTQKMSGLREKLNYAFGIHFIYYDEKNEMSFNPIIIGLSRSNILKKFRDSEHTGRIYYEYRRNMVLKLKCLSKHNKRSEWEFNDQDLTLKIEVNSNKDIAEEINFTMKENRNKAEIICRGESSTTRLILIRKGSGNNILHDNESVMDNYFPMEPEPSEKSQEKAKLASPPEESNSGNRITIIVIGVVVAGIIIAIAVWMIITIYKRKQNNKQVRITSTSINYETLPEHSKGPMPVPRQWQSEDPQYRTPVDANLDGMYTKPTPKHLRPKHVSAIYAEVQYADSPYAEIPNIENTYVEVSNKENPYAEITIEADKEKQDGINNIFPNNNAELMNVSARNTDDKYENVFDGQRYGNVHSKKDIVEPAYCVM